jgi:hypothetical protein
MTVCGRDGLFIFRGPEASPVAERLFAEFAPALVPLRLHAPGLERVSANSSAQDMQWHGLETDPRGAFRWSAVDTITWQLDPVPCYPCELLVRIPLLMSAFPTVLDGATLHAGEQSTTVGLYGAEIRARLLLADPRVRAISLRTRQPRSPAEMRGEPDRRPLGIAVLAPAADPVHE